MRSPRRLAPLALALLALPLALAAGCAKQKSVLRPDVPPETSVFVQFTPGPGHDVNHLVHLYWSGNDPDGDVVGYNYRFVFPGALPDTVRWQFTVRTDSVFAVYTPDGISAPTFEVRAIDDAGLIDPTPASQTFSFTNQPPTLTLTQRKLTDTTFASVTLSWIAFDPDGDNGRMQFRVWLDSLGNINGNMPKAFVTQLKTYTVPTAAFLQGGHLLEGVRKAYVQPIDDGGMLGAIDSTAWYVRAPVPGGDHGRLLLIDEVTGVVPGGATYDSLYSNTAKRNLGPNEYSILRLAFTQPFLSSLDVQQTFQLFDAVIWYRGPQGGLSSLLQNYQAGIEAYLDGGGRLMLEGLSLIDARNAPGSLSEDFAVRYLGADSLHFVPGFTDSTADMTINSGKFLYGRPFEEIVGDTAINMRSTIITGGLRGFVERDTNDVVIWAKPGNLSPVNAADVAIAVSVPKNPAQPAGGRCIVSTYPLKAAWHPTYPGVPRLLAKLFKQMGLAQ